MTEWAALAGELSSLLRLEAPPIGITFSDERPDRVELFDEPMPDATPTAASPPGASSG